MRKEDKKQLENLLTTALYIVQNEDIDTYVSNKDEQTKRITYLSEKDLSIVLGVSHNYVLELETEGLIRPIVEDKHKKYALQEIITDIRFGTLIIEDKSKYELLQNIIMYHPELSKLCAL